MEIKQVLKNIKNKGFGYIKIELEADMARATTSCSRCFGDGYYPCDQCDGDGHLQENGQLATCPNCLRGNVRCVHSLRYRDTSTCQRFINTHVSKKALKSLVYGRFMVDGSVDSEYTLTLPIQKAHYAVEFIHAFNKLAKAIGKPMEVQGAGMHIALMPEDSDGYYSRGDNDYYLDNNKLANFRIQMQKLLPALYFLGTGNHRTRGMSYRYPRISSEKYSAINYGSSVLEYRVFETCYDNPMQILQFFEVIEKSLNYWNDTIILPKKIMDSRYTFNIPKGHDLQRLFNESHRFDALKETLPYLQPDGTTFKSLCKQRSFGITLAKIKKQEQQAETTLRNQWPEFKERQEESLKKQLERAEFDYDNSPDWKAELRNDGIDTKDLLLKQTITRFYNGKPRTVRQFMATKKPKSYECNVTL